MQIRKLALPSEERLLSSFNGVATFTAPKPHTVSHSVFRPLANLTAFDWEWCARRMSPIFGGSITCKKVRANKSLAGGTVIFSGALTFRLCSIPRI